MVFATRPYIPYAAFDWLCAWIKSDMRIFEYGSGYSTLWFSQNVREVVSVEDCASYYQEVQDLLDQHGNNNFTYVLKQDEDSYSKYIHQQDGQFDMVFVDGRFRKACMEQCYDKARYAIFLDNSDAHHYQDAYQIMQTFPNGRLLDFYSRGINPSTGNELMDPDNPDSPLAWKASVFLKESVYER